MPRTCRSPDSSCTPSCTPARTCARPSHSPRTTGFRSRDADELIELYEQLYDEYLELDLGPYFRLLYNIIRLIENTPFSDDTDENKRIKLDYSKMLRAHLSSAEVKLIMFNCASVHGRGLKGWVEEHSLLRHIKRADYNEYSDLVKIYDPKAFNFDKRNSKSKK